MRLAPLLMLLLVVLHAHGADLESRVLTHYLPQDQLDAVVRTESWTEITLNVKGGVRKGDTVRIWAGGLVDRGGDQPGENCAGPSGVAAGLAPSDPPALALSPQAAHAYAVLCKTESSGPHPCLAPGKPLAIKLTRDKEKFFIGFNDDKGRYNDNHIGKGRRHELDPLWMRVEVVRIVVD